MYFDDTLEITIKRQLLDLQKLDTDEACLIYERAINILSCIRQQIDKGDFSYVLDISQGSNLLSFKIIDRIFASGLVSEQKIGRFKKELKLEIMEELQGAKKAADELAIQYPIQHNYEDNLETIIINIYSLLLESVNNPHVLSEIIDSILDGVPNPIM